MALIDPSRESCEIESSSEARGVRRPRDPDPPPRSPWSGIRRLAQEIEDGVATTGELDSEAVARLAHAILLFQLMLLGRSRDRR